MTTTIELKLTKLFGEPNKQSLFFKETLQWKNTENGIWINRINLDTWNYVNRNTDGNLNSIFIDREELSRIIDKFGNDLKNIKPDDINILNYDTVIKIIPKKDKDYFPLPDITHTVRPREINNIEYDRVREGGIPTTSSVFTYDKMLSK